MVSIDDMQDLLLYKRPFFLPIEPKDKKKNSLVMLVTPNYKSSVNCMTAPYIINRKYFESYYIEKDIKRYIHGIDESVFDDEYLFEVTESEVLEREVELADEVRSLNEASKKYKNINTISFIIHANGKLFVVQDTEKKFVTIPTTEYAKNDNLDSKVVEYGERVGLKIKSYKRAFETDFYYTCGTGSYLDHNTTYIITELESGSTDGKFMSPNKIKHLGIDLSPQLKYTLSRYGSGNDTKETEQNEYLADKIGAGEKIIFSGYSEDVKAVSKYVSFSKITDAFDRLKEKHPDHKIHVLCSGNSTDFGYIDKNNITLIAPKAFKKSELKMDYEDYITFTLQLYAVRYLNPDVHQKIADPIAIVLSGLLDSKFEKEDKTGERKKDYDVERVYRYILKKDGIKPIREIIINNDYALVLLYAEQYVSKNYDKAGYNNTPGTKYLINLKKGIGAINEDGETTSSSEPEEKKTSDFTLDDLKDLGTDLKRKIRSQTVWKLNKIARDIQRGNVGSELKGAINSLQQLQSNPAALAVNNSPGSKVDASTEASISEADNTNNYDILLKNLLYRDRFKTAKDVLNLYQNVKAQNPWIKYTFINLNRYLDRNLFFDFSYYNESFFKNLYVSGREDNNIVNPKKIANLYIELLERMLVDDRFGRYTKKTIFIPILDWRHDNSARMWMYREDMNPIALIYHMLRTDRRKLIKIFGNSDIIFMGAKNYFKVNFSKDFNNQADFNTFLNLIKRIVKLGYNSPADPDPEGVLSNSPKGIAMGLIDKIEKSRNVEINDVTPVMTKGAEKQDLGIVPAKITSTKPEEKNIAEPQTDKEKAIKVNNPSNSEKVNTANKEEKTKAIVDKVVKAANKSSDEDDAMDKLDADEEFKNMIIDLGEEAPNNVKYDKARASRMAQLEDEFKQKEVRGKSVANLLKENPNDKKLPETKLKVASINKDWEHMTFMNFDKNYDPDSDIVKMLDSMKNWTYPIMVRNIEVTDNSTSQDILDLWKIECEDYKGTRFTLKVDIPKFISGDYLKLHGNEKTLMIQSTTIPIIKTGFDTCQIVGVGGYNKISVFRFGGNKGRSCPDAFRLTRAIQKYSKAYPNDIKIVNGDNSRICEKYELPIDYIDLARFIDTIDTKNYKIFFNQDELRKIYKIDDTKGIPVGVKKGKDEEILYFTVNDKKDYSTICNFINCKLGEFNEEYKNISLDVIASDGSYAFTRCKMLDTLIPMIIILGYLEGLIKVMKKAGIKYSFKQKLDMSDKKNILTDYIKFKDGYLVYETNYSASLLMSGLRRCDTESHSLSEINDRKMYLDFLDGYGGHIRAGGIENSYDCMIDPITKEILEIFKLPTDYVSVMLHANNLLADNKYVRHTDQAGRRFRRKEIIAGYFYKALTYAYQTYANQIRNTRKTVKLTMKQSAVVDLILSGDPSTNDVSVNNVINDVEAIHTVTGKGLVGLNKDRAYGVDKRTYDSSMLNILGQDTGFSGTVGINRQATIDANIEGARGFVKTIDGDTDQFSPAKTLTVTEAMTPFGCTHDDPPRTLMTYVQTSKHTVRCEHNDPLLITNGADEALPYLASDIFAPKAKMKGEVVEIVDGGDANYMIVKYEDDTYQYVNLDQEIKKNSDGGYSVPMKLTTELKVGSKVKEGDILAYDPLSFSHGLGESGNLAANTGTLAKVAIITTDDTFEDSAIITQKFADKLGTAVVMPKEIILSKNDNIFMNKNIGDAVSEGEIIMSIQEGADNDEAIDNILKNLSDNRDNLLELGRKPIKSHYTGWITDIQIYRTCDLDEMSESLRNFVTHYERKIRKKKAIYKKYGLNENLLPPTSKVPQIGKTKNVEDGVMIIIYTQYIDRMSPGDKITFYSANKGVIKRILQPGEEPYTDFRPTETIDSFTGCLTINSRMTASNLLYCAVGKLLVELDRSVKDIAGIPYDVTKL